MWFIINKYVLYAGIMHCTYIHIHCVAHKKVFFVQTECARFVRDKNFSTEIFEGTRSEGGGKSKHFSAAV